MLVLNHVMLSQVDSSADVSGGKENIDGTDTAPLINSHSEIIEGKSQNTFVLCEFIFAYQD